LADHLVKYKVAFANYDTDHDGYLMNEQARDILLQTRLDPSDLLAIWELADRPPVRTIKLISLPFLQTYCRSDLFNLIIKWFVNDSMM
jgi:hypothetical protein